MIVSINTCVHINVYRYTHTHYVETKKERERERERVEDTLYGKVGLLPTENNDLTK